MGLFELAQAPGNGAGERALLVPEKLGFDQLGRHGGAIQGDEGPVAARAALVQGAGDQLLPGPGFAQNADPRFAGGYAVHLSHEAQHHPARVDDFVLADPLAQIAVLVFQALELEDVADREQEFIGGERLLQEIHRAEPRSAHRHFDVGLSGDHYARQGNPEIAKVFEQ